MPIAKKYHCSLNDVFLTFYPILVFKGLVPKETDNLDSIHNAVEDEISSTAEVSEINCGMVVRKTGFTFFGLTRRCLSILKDVKSFQRVSCRSILINDCHSLSILTAMLSKLSIINHT